MAARKSTEKTEPANKKKKSATTTSRAKTPKGPSAAEKKRKAKEKEKDVEVVEDHANGTLERPAKVLKTEASDEAKNLTQSENTRPQTSPARSQRRVGGRAFGHSYLHSNELLHWAPVLAQTITPSDSPSPAVGFQPSIQTQFGRSAAAQYEASQGQVYPRVSPSQQQRSTQPQTPQNEQGQQPAQSQARRSPPTPQQQLKPHQTKLGNLAKGLFRSAINGNTSLLPEYNSVNGVLDSNHIAAITYDMWNLALISNNGKGDVLWAAADFSAMFSDLKLRTIARMNFLPSWWFFRDRVVEELGHLPENWIIDDSIMTQQLQEALAKSREFAEYQAASD